MICLRAVDERNWRAVTKLKVSEEQEHHVSSSMGILARAYAYHNHRGTVKAIYHYDILVGLLMYRDCDEINSFVLDQLMIDVNNQRNGYGREAVKQVINLMKEDSKYPRITLCYIEGDAIAKYLYTSLGFYHTGEVDEDEIIMAYDFS
ncbi:GNAT family N-acetyltransferase [Anaeromicropila herbilytica]|uniref:N-acetyltransferase n=1 Tax=Anaeromicropila herbilytica TaxID=2785025 RepID=A0A7R7EI62_9FIRM|nr:GNAT family N-acetyltransferase [Anaeromicropila herbilytica]BCN29131.1 N-acetyltransferase [Anaeromicropila herbilytica]